MTNKYDHYLNSAACETLKKDGYEQVITNIIEDDETYITEQMKKDFFEHIENYDGVSNLIEYCSDFFHTKKYQLNGKEASPNVYKIELGHVASKIGFRRGLNTVIFNLSAIASSGLSPISDISDEALLNNLLIDSTKINSTFSSNFIDLINDTGISNQKIKEYPMWTFEGYYDDNVYEGYNVKELPCILGLPGVDGTAKDYQNIERITFSLRIPNSIVVKKPTSFDAGTMPVWGLGGKTKIHMECKSTYGNFGFEEYIHEPITYNNITSELYTI